MDQWNRIESLETHPYTFSKSIFDKGGMNIVVQSSSCVQLFVTPWTAACQTSLSLNISWSLPKFISITSLMLSSHLILWCSLILLPSVLALGTSQISQLFTSDDQNTGASASASVLPISIQGWFPLRLTALISLLSKDSQESSPAPQFEGTNSLALRLLYSPISQPYMVTGKIIALTIWTFVSRVIFLLFNILSRFVTVFLPRSNCLLISWLQSSSVVILEPKKRKSTTTSTFPLLFPMK